MSQIDRPKLKQMNYEIFVIILTVLSWFNTLLFFVVWRRGDGDGRDIILWVQLVLSFFFFLDFLYRVKKVEDRSVYFRKVGWLDLIGSFPFLQWFRAYRVYRTSQYIRTARGHLLKEFFHARAETAVLTVTLAVVFLFEFASLFILRAEQFAPNANIKTAGDAVWWVLVTVATVGYGDMYPVTPDGRFIAAFVIVAGVGLFGILSGYLARSFLGSRSTVETDDDNNNQGISTDMNLAIEEILTELRDFRSQYAEANSEQEIATESLKERLAAVEKLLSAEKID